MPFRLFNFHNQYTLVIIFFVHFVYYMFYVRACTFLYINCNLCIYYILLIYIYRQINQFINANITDE